MRSGWVQMRWNSIASIEISVVNYPKKIHGYDTKSSIHFRFMVFLSVALSMASLFDYHGEMQRKQEMNAPQSLA